METANSHYIRIAFPVAFFFEGAVFDPASEVGCMKHFVIFFIKFCASELRLIATMLLPSYYYFSLYESAAACLFLLFRLHPVLAGIAAAHVMHLLNASRRRFLRFSIR